MRYNFTLILLLIIPYVAKGQEPVVFYSEGKMYVGEGIATDGTTSPSNTSLYVGGSMKFASKTAHQDSLTTVVQEGRTTLTGDLINALDPIHGVNHLFASGGNGEIAFGNDTEASSMKFTTSTASGASIADADVNWGLYNAQRIKSVYDFATQAGLTKIKEQKRNNYLDINKIIVPSKTYTGNKTMYGNYLTVDPSAAVQVAGLDVSSGAFFEIGTASTAADVAPANRYLHTGYVKFKNQLVAPSYTSGDVFRANYVHRVKLFEASGSNAHPDGGFYLTGFTPLFTGLMADYMFFNTLTEPGNGSVTSWKGTITDPTSMMKGGTGYFMAMTDFQSDYQEIANNHFGGDINESANRTKNEYVFNRTLMVKDGSLQQKFNKKASSNPDETFNPAEEIFNTKDINVKVKAGYNFLGNPFTAPLDLGDIVNVASGTAALPEFGGITVSAESSSNIKGIRNKYWVINKSTVKQDPTTAGWYEYTLSFYDAQVVGGTAQGLHGNKQNEFYVAPMQMFIVQGGSQCSNAGGGADCDFTIPYSKTVLAASSVTPRSANVQGERVDEFVLEAVDLDSNMEDRFSVVMRDNASLLDVDPTDTHKAVKVKENETSRIYPTMENIIYTRSSNDRPMLTNTIPTSTKQLAMYITSPTDKAKNMVVRPYRMETMSTVSRVWLEDKFENKMIELTPEVEYYFTSPVLTNEEASKNRFVLHFGNIDDNEDDLIVNEDLLSCYYNSSILYIKGLIEKDINSSVQLYDLQGRLVGKTTINTTGRMEYPKPLPQGTYIVKITGKRNYTSKFVNLHN